MGWGRNVDGQEVVLAAWPVDDRFIDFFGVEDRGGSLLSTRRSGYKQLYPEREGGAGVRMGKTAGKEIWGTRCYGRGCGVLCITSILHR